MHYGFTKRLVCLILVFAVLAAMPLTARAATDSDIREIKELIVQAYENRETEVDLTPYDIQASALEEIFESLKNDNRLPWYADWYSYRYYPETGQATAIVLKYYDPAVYDYAKYEQAIAEIMDETIFPGMSQWQIALSVHDYLAANYCYDETYTYYQAYDLVVGGTAVCNGYARAYMDILKRAGLEVIYATSDGMDHGWNLVKIGDLWYHVDVTWDDPVSDCYGRVRHFYFLLDDETIADSDHEHYGWEASQLAISDDMQNNVFWTDINSRICYESSSVSYLRKDESNEHWIYRRDEKTGELTELAYFDAGYLDVGAGSYHYQNYGLSLWNGKLYFSDMENVYVMNTDGSEKDVIYTWDAEANGKYIAGTFVNDGTIYITYSDHDGNYTYSETSVPNASWHEHSYTRSEVSPTCTQEGYEVYTCTCGSGYNGEPIEATGHQYSSGTVTREPTATSEGVRTYTCTVCGHTSTESIPCLEAADDTPTVTQPEATRPSTRYEEEEDDDEGGFPIIPVVIGVVVLLLILRPKKGGGSSRKAKGGKRSASRPVTVPSSGGEDYESDDFTDDFVDYTENEEFTDFDDFSDDDSFVDDFSDSYSDD